jgi:hypothetical protein
MKRIAVLVAALAALGFAALASVAVAQSGPPEFKQIKLVEEQVRGFIAAQKDIAAIAAKLQSAGDKIDPALQAELEGIAKKHGFQSFAELDDVAANISMVMAGLDPQTGDYVDPIESIKKEIIDIQKDQSIPEKDKKQLLAEMDEALKSTPPLKFAENIPLVRKFQKEIEQSLQ